MAAAYTNLPDSSMSDLATTSHGELSCVSGNLPETLKVSTSMDVLPDKCGNDNLLETTKVSTSAVVSPVDCVSENLPGTSCAAMDESVFLSVPVLSVAERGECGSSLSPRLRQ